MNKKLLALAAGAALLTVAQNGFAGTLSGGSVSYDIQLADSCTAASAAGVSFGTYATSAPDLNNAGAGTIWVSCPSGMSYRIMLDGGVNPSGNLRRMSDGAGHFMTYNLMNSSGVQVGDVNPMDGSYVPVYSPAGWASGINAMGSGGTDWHYLLADVHISSSPVQGSYTDSVGVTVTW